ncbi:hypothetical protein DICVIV_13162 [Dictyocaulus viviparus]|uniref:Guanylate cyclase domain-containing protein n=1 Tax=Dictyocaulus viviparus TaxID=29172 RepID=A0A0D8X8I0_DICVI|nr:hypothetical protein DICVIV_13162 [Dictyocaulus viviparus]
MDSYLVVSGAPDSNELNTESILNLAIAFVFSGRHITVPGINLPLRSVLLDREKFTIYGVIEGAASTDEQTIIVRVGINSGSIVAGVVSHEKPRYCIFGQTVNVAKRTCAMSQPGKILVTNVVQTVVAMHQKDTFVFEKYQSLECGMMNIQTHILLKNAHLSVWEIADAIKGADESIDGYKELHKMEGATMWEKIRIDVARQRQVIDAFRPGPSRTRRALTRLQSMKSRFRTAQSNDSGVSMNENVESVVCSIV